MSAVTIHFSNVVVPLTSMNIKLGNGTYVLNKSDGLSLAGSFPFTSLSVNAGNIVFNVPAQTTISGTLVVDVAVADGKLGTVTVNNFSTGTVNVEWPTSDGEGNQNAEPGNPIVLNDYSN